jgi:uncharacterized protein (DUF1330 family)
VTAYAVAVMTDIRMGPGIVDYLQRIDATLEPHGGRFIAHGARPVSLEGENVAGAVIIEFDNLELAKRWYESPAYQAIIDLRTSNTDGVAFLVTGVDCGYRVSPANQQPTPTTNDANPPVAGRLS